MVIKRRQNKVMIKHHTNVHISSLHFNGQNLAMNFIDLISILHLDDKKLFYNTQLVSNHFISCILHPKYF